MADFLDRSQYFPYVQDDEFDALLKMWAKSAPAKTVVDDAQWDKPGLKRVDWLHERLHRAEKDIKMTDRVYNVRLQSAFILTPTEVKKKLGIGYKVVEVVVEKENIIPDIKTVDDAFEAIIKTGFRALARSNHPDLGGDPNVMVTLNRAKKEIEALLKELKHDR